MSYHYLSFNKVSEMNYQGILKVDERLKIHEAKQKEYEIIPDDATPIEKQAIRKEKEIEDAIILELQQLKREMMHN